ncbi:hypothetical protein IPT12_00175 [Xanthomonas perforans]|uniref:Uncharacterized protein n=2 Tax=Xanthomonas TaxID=338 RepID=A0A0G9ALE0_XANPE|nr:MULTISPECIES: hypothetical protein [Xanthomonas]OHX23040.1 hypothetical protein BHL63_05750 [Xanthomonas alfalfae]APO99003.1 hypothetical protein BJD13_07895 [Xanthomonas perforans]AQS75514.1 hypothetical protein XPE_03625 [Xanthomonas perforans 91-118]KLC07811.1 hypothetical protein XP315_08325 [Xanthomonas perforans]KLC08742.1 hypothetical protein XP420_06975 [Xanthomonas perforans]
MAKISYDINAPSMAPALLAFDRSTARSDGTDSAVPAIEKLQTRSNLLPQRRADVGGNGAVAYRARFRPPLTNSITVTDSRQTDSGDW